MTWDQDAYIKAWNFASRAHAGQRVPASELPYLNHIGLVAMEAMAALAEGETVAEPDLLLQCALLHDTIEDTATTHAELEQTFGRAVADGVLALSKDKRLAKAHQLDDSIERIRCQPREVWMVKLCDRITNLQPPPAHWNRAKIQAYGVQAEVILEQLGEASEPLAQRLRGKIAAYRQHA